MRCLQPHIHCSMWGHQTHSCCHLVCVCHWIQRLVTGDSAMCVSVGELGELCDRGPLLLQNIHCSLTTLLILNVTQTAGDADSLTFMEDVWLIFNASWKVCQQWTKSCPWPICNYSSKSQCWFVVERMSTPVGQVKPSQKATLWCFILFSCQQTSPRAWEVWWVLQKKKIRDLKH